MDRIEREIQCKKVLEHLLSGRTITSREASRKFDIDRVSARVYDLRNLEWPIQTIRVTTPRKKCIAKYSL